MLCLIVVSDSINETMIALKCKQPKKSKQTHQIIDLTTDAYLSH